MVLWTAATRTSTTTSGWRPPIRCWPNCAMSKRSSWPDPAGASRNSRNAGVNSTPARRSSPSPKRTASSPATPPACCSPRTVWVCRVPRSPCRNSCAWCSSSRPAISMPWTRCSGVGSAPAAVSDCPAAPSSSPPKDSWLISSPTDCSMAAPVSTGSTDDSRRRRRRRSSPPTSTPISRSWPPRRWPAMSSSSSSSVLTGRSVWRPRKPRWAGCAGCTTMASPISRWKAPCSPAISTGGASRNSP